MVVLNYLWNTAMPKQYNLFKKLNWDKDPNLMNILNLKYFRIGLLVWKLQQCEVKYCKLVGFSLWCVITYNDWTAQRGRVSRGGNVVNRAAPFIKLKLIKSNVELLTGYWHNLVFDSELFFCLLGLLTP